jgi:hypothetical protein
MMDSRIRERLQDLVFDTHTEKVAASESDGAVVARRWAVLHTELEKALAYYIAFLESKESE